MENKNRIFTGIWIPKDIYLNKDVRWISKILFLEVHSFTANDKPCFMSNSYISTFLGISTRQVSRIISELKNIGWIEETAFDGRKRYLKSKIRIDFNTGISELTKTSRPHRYEDHSRLDNNVHDTKPYTKQNNFTINKQGLVKPNNQKKSRGKVIK